MHFPENCYEIVNISMVRPFRAPPVSEGKILKVSVGTGCASRMSCVSRQPVAAHSSRWRHLDNGELCTLTEPLLQGGGWVSEKVSMAIHKLIQFISRSHTHVSHSSLSMHEPDYVSCMGDGSRLCTPCSEGESSSQGPKESLITKVVKDKNHLWCWTSPLVSMLSLH